MDYSSNSGDADATSTAIDIPDTSSDMSSDVCEDTSADFPEDAPTNSDEEISDISVDLSENMPADIPEDVPNSSDEDISDISVDLSEDMPADIPEDVPNSSDEDISDISVDLSEDIPADIPEDVPNNGIEELSDGESTDIPEDVSETNKEYSPCNDGSVTNEETSNEISTAFAEDISSENIDNSSEGEDESLIDNSAAEFPEDTSKVSSVDHFTNISTPTSGDELDDVLEDLKNSSTKDNSEVDKTNKLKDAYGSNPTNSPAHISKEVSETSDENKPFDLATSDPVNTTPDITQYTPSDIPDNPRVKLTEDEHENMSETLIEESQEISVEPTNELAYRTIIQPNAYEKVGKNEKPNLSETNEYFSTYQERIDHTPTGLENAEGAILGEWDGERGESTYYSYDSEAHDILHALGIDGIEYKDGIPDFSPVAKETVEIDRMSDSRLDNFKKADEQAALKWGVDFSPRDVKNWRQENGYSWHERNDMKTCDLISSKINSVFNHLGGVSECKKAESVNIKGDEFDE